LKDKTSPATDAMTGLMGAHATITRELSAELVARHGLTLNDYATLLLLWRAGDEGMRRIDLAMQLQLSPSGITRLLDRLEAKGLVSRARCLKDRRQVHCRITSEGLDLLKLLDAPVSAAEEAVMKPIGRAGQQQLIGLLDRLRAGSPVSQK